MSNFGAPFSVWSRCPKRTSCSFSALRAFFFSSCSGAWTFGTTLAKQKATKRTKNERSTKWWNHPISLPTVKSVFCRNTAFRSRRCHLISMFELLFQVVKIKHGAFQMAKNICTMISEKKHKTINPYRICGFQLRNWCFLHSGQTQSMWFFSSLFRLMRSKWLREAGKRYIREPNSGRNILFMLRSAVFKVIPFFVK